MTLRERIRRGERVFGTLSLLPEPSLPELVGGVGFDFYVIDTEHVALDGQHLAHIVRAAQAAAIAPLVRIRHAEEKTILWTLDLGVEGLMIPLLEDAETARLAFDLSRYPPEGRRTLCSASRSAAHGARRDERFGDYLVESNERIVLVGLIETMVGVDNLDAILAEPIDVICIGRGDLSLKLGFPYQPLHPKVTEVTEGIVERTLARGKAASIVAYDFDDARHWIDRGCTFVIYGQPEMILSNHYRDALQRLQALA